MTAEVGSVAPGFVAEGVQGTMRASYDLTDFRGQVVVLAFYPGDFTPG